MSGDLFRTLGVEPEVGRALSTEEIAAGTAVVVLSHGLWQRRFHGDKEGRVITIDGAPHAVVGVMPAGRGYPNDADLWRPLTAAEHEDDDRDYGMLARLRGDTSVARASAELAAMAHAGSKGVRTAWADDVQRAEVRDVRTALTAPLASAALILLIACANVAALVGARGADRAGEMAVRCALGASRARLIGQLLTESLMLAAAGGAVGLVLGRWMLDLLVALAPAGIPRLAEITLDGRVTAAGLGATIVVGLAVGLATAFRASRLNLGGGLRVTGWHRAARRANGRRVLVAAQMAMAVVLSVGAGLLARSLQHLVTTDHGFVADRLVAVDLYLRGQPDTNEGQLFHQLVEQAETLPGVRAAAVTMRLPTQIAGLRAPVRVVGGSDVTSPATLRPIGPRYFETAGIPLTDGRAFSAADAATAPRVVIVNAAFVRDVLGGGAAIGTRLTTTIIDGSLTVVGVAADVTPAGAPDRAALYVPVDQLDIGGGYLLVRTDDDPRSVIPALTSRVRAVAPALALDRIQRVADMLEAGRAVTRFNTQLTSSFAGLALLLAAIGGYGLTAGEVSARWRELAVRLALGASHRAALWTVIRPSAFVLGAGMSVGVLASLTIGPWLASLLHGVEPQDMPTVLVAPVLLGIVGMAAAWLAAARVLRADPAATLRGE